MKNYSIWLKAAGIFQFITAIIHSATLFITLPPNNETEKQLSVLMNTYQFDMGAGFHRTMNDMTIALSACLCLVCLLGGLLNWYLLRKKVEPQIMKGVININLFVFGISFVLIARFAFLEPVILMGLIVLCLILARVTIGKASGAQSS
ncbi:MAG: hypothetical protein JWM28_3185 [Chitinophagaceae bacterium]|nr:hypothetical protein [Chitinophagaceae bacterium]